MPYVNVKITKGGVTAAQKRKLVADITSSLVSTLGKKPEHIHIVIDEIKPENWGYAGMLVISVLALVGCASVDQWRRSHSFQKNLYVANLSVPHLTKAEWEEINAQLATRTEYLFRDGTRERADRVEVSLGLKADRDKGVILRFEKRGEKWVENTAKAEVVEYLIP